METLTLIEAFAAIDSKVNEMTDSLDALLNNLYVDGSLVHANMANREEALKVYFSYMRVEVQKELNQEK